MSRRTSPRFACLVVRGLARLGPTASSFCGAAAQRSPGGSASLLLTVLVMSRVDMVNPVLERLLVLVAPSISPLARPALLRKYRQSVQ